MYRSRLQSEVEASPAHHTRNRILAASLSELLESRKTVKSQEELRALAERYDVDVAKLTELARFINTPSIDEGTIVRSVNQDGEETLTMTVSPCQASYVVQANNIAKFRLSGSIQNWRSRY